MGKRSDFPRIARDLYSTPLAATAPLIPFLRGYKTYAEPCAGAGKLIDNLNSLSDLSCVYSGDTSPHLAIIVRDALTLQFDDLSGAELFITNPPWPHPREGGEPTLGLIRHLSSLRPTWLLLPADIMHNVYAAEVLIYCQHIVSVGRVKWMPGTKFTGLDNAAWFLFDQCGEIGRTVFHPRVRK